MRVEGCEVVGVDVWFFKYGGLGTANRCDGDGVAAEQIRAPAAKYA